ncbi:glycosyltransferase [Aliivibrio fischeri]|uniref:glycosyltransferase family 4 protein n=1 Tax=Aliivibrio fischeri TaxID=668 RepID=UPI0012D8FEA7|nr:glycosyltransferase family 4 protein [Aliivibrio fischeri]MUK77052.1 glycosyltransferase [Aliivibrio fischeri]
MKKYLLIASEYPPVGGGAGVVARQVINDANNLKIKKIDYYICKLNFKNKLSKFFKLIFIYKDIISKKELCKYDVIILNDNDSILIAGLFFSKAILNRCKVIVHGDFYIKYIDNVSIKNRLRFYKYAYNRTIVNSSMIVCVSQYIRDGFELKFNKYLNKINYIYCGTNIASQDICFLNSKQKNSSGSCRFLSVGRIEKSKGFIEKLELFYRLKKKNNRLTWDVVGNGSFLNDFIKLINEYGLEESVIIHGYLCGDDLYRLYKESDFFWLLPNKPEAFGLVYIEAQLFGLPSIGRDIGGVSEAIELEKGLVLSYENLDVQVDAIFNFINQDFCYKELSDSIINKFDSTDFCLALLDMVNDRE